MKKFEKFTGTICAVDRANIDTDALIPKEYLRSIKRTGFGHALFSDWRYTADGSDNPAFILNQSKTQGASILVGRTNFGCGSSREHAVWAVAQQGFKVVIAPAEGEVPAFADIFRNNCAKNGVLTIELSSEELNSIFKMAEAPAALSATVDLAGQKVIVGGVEFAFDLDPAVKEKLMLGMDDISETLLSESAISTFEKTHNPQLSAI